MEDASAGMFSVRIDFGNSIWLCDHLGMHAFSCYIKVWLLGWIFRSGRPSRERIKCSLKQSFHYREARPRTRNNFNQYLNKRCKGIFQTAESASNHIRAFSDLANGKWVCQRFEIYKETQIKPCVDEHASKDRKRRCWIFFLLTILLCLLGCIRYTRCWNLPVLENVFLFYFFNTVRKYIISSRKPLNKGSRKNSRDGRGTQL